MLPSPIPCSSTAGDRVEINLNNEKNLKWRYFSHGFREVNQVIYTLDTIYDPNIMTLAQAVLEEFCSQAYIGL